MDEEFKKRLATLRATGKYSEEEIQATIKGVEAAKAKQTQDAAAASSTTGMSVDTAVAPTPAAPPQEGILKSVVRGLVKPAVDYGKMVAGAGFEGYRAIKDATGDKNAYVDKNGKIVANPFLTQEDLTKFSPSAQGGYVKPLLEGAKRTAGMEAYLIPGGTGVKGAMAAGAGAGALYGFSQSKADDIEGMAVDTAVGGLTGAATGGALKVGGKILGATKGAGTAVRREVANPKVNPDPFMAEEEAAIMKTLQSNGLKGSAEAQKQQIPQVFRTISANIKKQLSSSKGRVSTSDATRMVDDALDSNINFDLDNPVMVKAKDKYMNQLVKAANSTDEPLNLRPAQLFEFKQNLGKQLSNVFKKLDKGTPLSEKEEVAYTVWSAVDDMITAAEPGVKEMTRAQSHLYKAMPGIASSAASKTKLPIVGTIPGATRPIQATEDAIGRTLEGAGGLVEKVPTAVGSATMKAAPLVAADMTNGSPQNTPAGMSVEQATAPVADATTATDSNPVTFVSPDGQWQTKADGNSYSMDDQWMWDKTANDWVANPNATTNSEGLKAQLVEAMKNATDKKSFDFAKAKYDQLVKMETGSSGGSLTAGQQKELSDIDTSIELMGSLPATIKKYESKMSPVQGRLNALNEYDVDAQTFNANMKAISQMVGKAMEGGVLRKEDEEKYRKMLPTINDTPQVAYNKVQTVVKMLYIQKKVKEKTYGGATADFTTGIDVNAAIAE